MSNGWHFFSGPARLIEFPVNGFGRNLMQFGELFKLQAKFADDELKQVNSQLNCHNLCLQTWRMC